jgi:hypothetical protein
MTLKPADSELSRPYRPANIPAICDIGALSETATDRADLVMGDEHPAATKPQVEAAYNFLRLLTSKRYVSARAYGRKCLMTERV